MKKIEQLYWVNLSIEFSDGQKIDVEIQEQDIIEQYIKQTRKKVKNYELYTILYSDLDTSVEAIGNSAYEFKHFKITYQFNQFHITQFKKIDKIIN